MTTPQTISAEQLTLLTGLTDRTHRSLSQQGYFPPKNKAGLFLLVPTIQGLFRYYRELAEKRTETLQGAAEKKLMGQADIWHMKAERERGKLLAAEDFSDKVVALLTNFRMRLENLGDSLGAICHEQPSEFISGRINDNFRSAFAELAAFPYVPDEVKKKAMLGPLPPKSSGPA